jgi:hypothetical protein
MSHFSKYHEMRTPNSLAPGGEEQMFKCVDCGAESFPEKGWGGSPDTHRCSHDCRMDHGDWVNGKISRSYRQNFDRVFPDAPGAGL